ncbi:hypothetical protein [Hymenobacter chitinivorans]|nr:hypothetical protein [Hymenobacter chitinivorans]
MNSIRLCEPLEGADFKPVLDRFGRVLQRIGAPMEEVQRMFDAFTWDVNDIGWVFSSEHVSEFIPPGFTIPLYLTIDGMAPEMGNVVGNWLCCDLYTDTHRLLGPGYFYHAQAQRLVEYVAHELRREFPQAAIYFVDEVQLGDFDAARQPDPTKLWEFEYALLPPSLYDTYAAVPATHATAWHEEYLEAWYQGRWPK